MLPEELLRVWFSSDDRGHNTQSAMHISALKLLRELLETQTSLRPTTLTGELWYQKMYDLGHYQYADKLKAYWNNKRNYCSQND